MHLGVFMHRGDSQGEGGSNVWFLANRRRDHEPVSNLWDKISIRLADQSIVVTDGSNCRIRQIRALKRRLREIRRSSGRATISVDAYNEAKGLQFIYGPFEWKVIGYLKPRYGPTLVWGLTRRNGVVASER
jgi:hypothetical protein